MNIKLCKDCLDNANSSALQISFAPPEFPGGHNVLPVLGVTGIVDEQDVGILLVQREYHQAVRGDFLNTTTVD